MLLGHLVLLISVPEPRGLRQRGRIVVVMVMMVVVVTMAMTSSAVHGVGTAGVATAAAGSSGSIVVDDFARFRVGSLHMTRLRRILIPRRLLDRLQRPRMLRHHQIIDVLHLSTGTIQRIPPHREVMLVLLPLLLLLLI